MLQQSRSLTRLVGELKKLPGVGEKTAARLAFHLLKSPRLMQELAGRPLDIGHLELVVPIFRIAHMSMDAEGDPEEPLR